MVGPTLQVLRSICLSSVCGFSLKANNWTILVSTQCKDSFEKTDKFTVTFNRMEKILRVTIVAKKGIHLGLFIAFLVLSYLAIKDLLSYATTFKTTQETRDIVVPSFTACIRSSRDGDTSYFDTKSLTEGEMGVRNKTLFPFPFTAELFLKRGNQMIRIDLANETILRNQLNCTLEKIWSSHCKVYYNKNDTCWPCITFNAPTFKAERTFNEVSSYFVSIKNMSSQNYAFR